MNKPDGFNELHEQALSLLTSDFQAYADLRMPTEELTGYDHPFTIFEDLVCWGYADRRLEQLYGANHRPRGCHYFYRAVAAYPPHQTQTRRAGMSDIEFQVGDRVTFNPYGTRWDAVVRAVRPGNPVRYRLSEVTGSQPLVTECSGMCIEESRHFEPNE